MKHQSFIDWMKAIGMLLIVTGHVFGDPFHIFNSISQPIYTKQLGVVFFVFITGWSLANETRSGFRVVFNRVFPVYFYGFLFTALLSMIYFCTGNDINESNYLPFLGGINVFFNYFPANPTTWYIGTYLHLILFWYFFIRGKAVGRHQLVVAFVIENAIRCILIVLEQNMMAYMVLPNWLTVFLLGRHLHEKCDTTWNWRAPLMTIAWIAILLYWSSSLNLLSFDSSFPFRRIITDGTWGLLISSLLISTIYLSSALAAFVIARRLPQLRVVSFFARNTLIIFIVHMPVIFAFSHYIYSDSDIIWIRKLIFVAMLFVSIAFASESIQKAINIKVIREKLWCAMTRRP